MDKPFPAYKGDETYVFVCYAHDDAALVYPEITRLHELEIELARIDTGQICDAFYLPLFLSCEFRFLALGYFSNVPSHKITSETKRVDEAVRQHQRPEIALKK